MKIHPNQLQISNKDTRPLPTPLSTLSADSSVSDPQGDHLTHPTNIGDSTTSRPYLHKHLLPGIARQAANTFLGILEMTLPHSFLSSLRPSHSSRSRPTWPPNPKTDSVARENVRWHLRGMGIDTHETGSAKSTSRVTSFPDKQRKRLRKREAFEAEWAVWEKENESDGRGRWKMGRDTITKER